jgi:hypothetical protein
MRDEPMSLTPPTLQFIIPNIIAGDAINGAAVGETLVNVSVCGKNFETGAILRFYKPNGDPLPDIAPDPPIGAGPVTSFTAKIANNYFPGTGTYTVRVVNPGSNSDALKFIVKRKINAGESVTGKIRQVSVYGDSPCACHEVYVLVQSADDNGLVFLTIEHPHQIKQTHSYYLTIPGLPGTSPFFPVNISLTIDSDSSPATAEASIKMPPGLMTAGDLQMTLARVILKSGSIDRGTAVGDSNVEVVGPIDDGTNPVEYIITLAGFTMVLTNASPPGVVLSADSPGTRSTLSTRNGVLYQSLMAALVSHCNKPHKFTYQSILIDPNYPGAGFKNLLSQLLLDGS